jgi:hypothetical protein
MSTITFSLTAVSEGVSFHKREGTMLTHNQKQRLQLTAFAAAAVVFSIAVANPHFRASLIDEMVLLSEAQTLQAEAKLAAFKRVFAAGNQAATTARDVDHRDQHREVLP